MSYRIVSDEHGLSQVCIDNEPDYIVPLTTQPSSLEEPLKVGNWLIVSMSLWSVHDIRAGRQAIEAIKRLNGHVKLGLRLFDYPQENAKWIPNVDPDRHVDQLVISEVVHDSSREVTIQAPAHSSPVWVEISDGAVIGVWHGQLQNDALDAIIAKMMTSGD